MSKGRLLFYLGFLLSAGFWFSANYAWMTHREWVENGNYARNSLPMNRIARDQTVGAVVVTALWLGITGWQLTRRPKQR